MSVAPLIEEDLSLYYIDDFYKYIISSNDINLNLPNRNIISLNYNKLHENSMNIYNSMELKGEIFRTPLFWETTIPLQPLINTPIRYLEIGVYKSINSIIFSELYAKHTESEIHCIDPWINYDDYEEYKTTQNEIYNTFLQNYEKIPSSNKSKFKIHRGFSFDILPSLPNDYFDIIYIDGNHNSNSVLEDAVLSFRKLKNGGCIIFDDANWDDTHVGICSFINAYKNKIKFIKYDYFQLFIQKIENNEINETENNNNNPLENNEIDQSKNDDNDDNHIDNDNNNVNDIDSNDKTDTLKKVDDNQNNIINISNTILTKIF